MLLHIAAALPVRGKGRFAHCIKYLHGMREGNLNLKNRIGCLFIYFKIPQCSAVFHRNYCPLLQRWKKNHPFLSFRTTLVLSKIFLTVHFSQWKCGLPDPHQAYHSWYKSFLSITVAINLSHPLKSREDALIILLTFAGVLALQKY